MAVKGGYWFKGSGVDASTINSAHFTHLFCAFADFNSETNEISVSPECTTFTQIVRQRNPSVKTLLSIGGASASSSIFNTMASQPISRQTFIQSCITVARSNAFDGIDLDWEGQTESDEMNNLAGLLTDFREAINVDDCGSQPLIFTMAVGHAPTVYTGDMYPSQVMAITLDWVNVMSYDFYSPRRSPNLTRSHAALNNPTGGPSGSRGITAWITAGVPANKLVFGLPFYGNAWQLQNPANHGIDAPANGPDDSVGRTWNNEIPTYDQILSFIHGPRNAMVVYDPDYVTNYCYSDATWVNYDDTESISTKVLYAKNNDLLGYFAWSLTHDENGILATAAFQAWGDSKRSP